MGETVRLGPIGRRVLAAFLVVALTSIAVLAGATIIGVDLSRAEATRAQRAEMTATMAAVAGSAFAEAGAFTGPELADAAQDAEVAGGHLIVVASDRAVVYGGPVARGSGRSRSRPR